MSGIITNTVVKVHPIVHMTILDAYTRRSRSISKNSTPSDMVVGTLLGYYQHGDLQVTNCFAIPFTENRDSVEIDDTFNEEMIAYMEKSFPTECPVGWFATVNDLSVNTMSFHDYFSGVTAKTLANKKHKPPTVLLTMDPSFSGEGAEKYRLSVRAYCRLFGGIHGLPQPHCILFYPLRVELDTYQGEKVALAAIQGSLKDPKGEAKILTGMERLQNDTEGMINYLKQMQTYVADVIANEKFESEEQMGRQLQAMVNRLSSLLPEEKRAAFVDGNSSKYNMISDLVTMVKTHLDVTDNIIQNRI